MADDTTRARIGPTRFSQKCKPIAVVDKVRSRYDKTSDYWSVEIGDYGDGCSALGCAGSMKTDGKKWKRSAPQAMEEFEWTLYDVTKMVVEQTVLMHVGGRHHT